MTDPQIIRDILIKAKEYLSYQLSNRLLNKKYGIDECTNCDNYELISDITKNLDNQVSLNIFNGTTEVLYSSLNDLLGNYKNPFNPVDTAFVKWGYTEQDEYSDVDSIVLQFSSLQNDIGANQLDFTSSANNKYLIVRYLATLEPKTTWYNTSQNYGTIPDQVFYEPITIGNYTYYSTRNTVSLDSSNTTIIFN